MVMNLEVVDSLSSLKVSDAMSTDVVQGTVSEPLSEAVTRMLDRDVGCIVITENGKIQGVITKGDVLRRAFLLGLDAREVSCKRAMTQPVLSIDPETRIEDAAKLMGDRNVSKLPVVKNGKLVGIITSSDIIRAEPVQVGYLQELIRARYVPHERI
jgi:CBS domain-containing protein